MRLGTFQRSLQGRDMYLPHIFSDGELHLVLWRRLNEACHEEGLGLAKRLLAERDLVGEVMVLLRPYSRRSYDHFRKGFAIPDQPLSSSNDDPWCELWVQTSRPATGQVGERLRAFRTDDMRRCFLGWIGDGGALWAPLSAGIHDCQYAATCPGGAQRWLAQVPIDEVAWLLKLMWHRATDAVLTHCLAGPALHLLDPRKDQIEIAQLADKSLCMLRPAVHGIHAPDEGVDPASYGVSHLAVGAINGVTTTDSAASPAIYRLEDYYRPYYCRAFPSRYGGGLATRPHLFDSREQYLDSLRNAV